MTDVIHDAPLLPEIRITTWIKTWKWDHVVTVTCFMENIERDHVVYIGRWKRDGVTPSPLANPYSHLPNANAIHVDSVGEALMRYDLWLREKIREGEHTPQYKELYRLVQLAKKDNLVLVCHCSPKPCHGDILAKAILHWIKLGY